MPITILMAVSIFSMADDIVITRTADSKKFEYARGRIPEGVKVTLALLESCTSIDYGSTPFQADDLKRREGDHIRIQFPKDVTVTLGNAKVLLTSIPEEPLSRTILFPVAMMSVFQMTIFTRMACLVFHFTGNILTNYIR